MKVCAFEACTNNTSSKKADLCHSHYQQLRNKGTLAELKPRAKRNPWVGEFHICPGCGENKHQSEHDRNASRLSGFSDYCTECKRWQKVKYKYGLTREEWVAIFEYQGSCCAVCGSEDPGSEYGWHVDHDHSCCPGKRSCGECVMGILDSRCNVWGDRKQEQAFTGYRKRVNALGMPLRIIATRRFELTA